MGWNDTFRPMSDPRDITKPVPLVTDPAAPRPTSEPPRIPVDSLTKIRKERLRKQQLSQHYRIDKRQVM